jgi:hypothetical protein
VAHVDIAADLNSEDETGFVWTFLDEALEPSIIRPGAVVVVAGSELTQVACQVVDLVQRPAGTVVHLRVLPVGHREVAAGPRPHRSRTDHTLR